MEILCVVIVKLYQLNIIVIIILLIFHLQVLSYVRFTSAVVRISVRVRVSFARLRFTRPRFVMRISVLASASFLIINDLKL